MEIRHDAGECWFFGILILLLIAAPAASQHPAGPPPIDRSTNPDRARQQDMSKREWQLRNFGNEPNRPEDRKKLEALMAQTEEDFKRILTLHNEIVRFIQSTKALDYGFVSEATGEIKKRATRLQSTLALQPPPNEEKAPEKPADSSDSEVKDSLIKLCKLVRSFVTNPIIENPNTVNADQLTNARRDLENLVRISGQIKKDVDKLGRIRR